MSSEISKDLKIVLASIEKNHGKGAIMKLTDKPVIDPNNTISSGSICLNAALGIGGYRKGRIVEIYGPESSGKTTLTLHAIADEQSRGGTCAFIDAEHALDPIYASHLGVNLDSLLISQPDFGEQALNIVSELARSGAVQLIVVDSVAALTPQKELEGDIGDHHVGSHARMMSQAMRILHGVANQSGCTIIFINQIRMKIGVLFGSPETTTGGNAIKFYASQRLDIRRIGEIKDQEKIIGNRTKVKIVKNKLAPPFRTAEFDIRFGIGIDQLSEVLDLSVQDEIIKKSGAWYSYEGTNIGQGKQNTLSFLKDNPDIFKKIKEKVMELRGLGDPEPTKDKEKENV